MPKLSWSKSFGKRAGKNRPSGKVRVFEREDVPGTIFIERHWITAADGCPLWEALPAGTTRAEAESIGLVTANARDLAIRSGEATEKERYSNDTVLVETLVYEYHKSREAMRWGKRHRIEQERCRRFWNDLIGDRRAMSVSAAEIERKCADAAKYAGWSARTEEKYLKYLKTLSRWSVRKGGFLKYDPWQAVDLPDVRQNTRCLIYEIDDARALCRPHPDVDWRVTLACSITCDTGRRLGAIRHVRVPDHLHLQTVELDDGSLLERVFLEFEAEHDKAGYEGIIPVSEHTRRLIAKACEQPEVIESGWLFPEGQLGRNVRREKPVLTDSLCGMLRVAEEASGIPHIPGRGFHGLKRLHVTISDEIANGNLSLVSDLTGNRTPQVLQERYRFPRLARMAEHGDKVAARIHGFETAGWRANMDVNMDAGKNDNSVNVVN